MALAVSTFIVELADLPTDRLVMDVRAFEGEPWRIVSSALPHAGIVHLGFNLVWLWLLGTALEKQYGWWRTALLYLLLSGGSTLAEYALFGSGVGLSGIGYGLFGVLWVLHRQVRPLHDAMDARTRNLFVGWFFFCIAATALGFMRIANVAHGAGAVLGGLVGVAVAFTGWRRVISSVAVGLVLAASVAGATVARPWVNLSDEPAADSLALGNAAYDAADFEKAIPHYEKAVKLSPDIGSWWYNLGLAYMATNRHEEAERALARAVELDPSSEKFRQTSAELAWERGTEAMEEGRLEEAVALLERAVSVDESSIGAHINLGIAYSRLGKAELALKAYQKAYRLDPNDPRAKTSLALETMRRASKLEENEPKRAIELYENATHIDSSIPLAWSHLGLAYVNAGRGEDGVRAYQRAAQLEPTNAAHRSGAAYAHATAAQLALKSGRTEDAIDQLRKSLELEENPHIWAALAMAYDKAGKRQLAEQARRNAQQR